MLVNDLPSAADGFKYSCIPNPAGRERHSSVAETMVDDCHLAVPFDGEIFDLVPERWGKMGNSKLPLVTPILLASDFKWRSDVEHNDFIGVMSHDGVDVLTTNRPLEIGDERANFFVTTRLARRVRHDRTLRT